MYIVLCCNICMKNAFFKKKDELTMIAPDGKRSKLAVDELKSVIDQLPETPELEKKLQKQMEDNFKQRKQAANPKLEPLD